MVFAPGPELRPTMHGLFEAMSGEIIYEEKEKASPIRILSSEGGEVKVEVSLQTEGKIQGVEQACL